MPAGVSAYVALATTTLASNTAQVTFSSISQSYRDLVVVIAGSLQSATPSLRFNGVTTSSYEFTAMEGNGSTMVSFLTSSTSLIFCSNIFGTGSQKTISIANIMDYSATGQFKTVLGRASNGNTSGRSVAFGGRFTSTSAITSVAVLTHNANPYETGTTISLYGISS
jgi:hypothetical protein